MNNPRSDKVAFAIFVITILALFMTTIVMFSGCSAIDNVSMANKSGCKASCVCEPCLDRQIDLIEGLR